MAHGFLESFSPEIDVFSADFMPAENVNPLIVKVLEDKDIDIGRHTPYNVTDILFDISQKYYFRLN